MCNLWDDYAIAVQLVLGLSIILVLVLEYIVEKCRKEFPRTFVQFWFDSFKLCCGAMVTHGFNVLCASILKSASSSVDECAVYMIAFYYEATGITLVQMMQYGLVKYSRRKYLEIYYKNGNVSSLSSNIFYWISYPGHYIFKSKLLESSKTLLSDNNNIEPQINQINNNNLSNINDDNDNDIDYGSTNSQNRIKQQQQQQQHQKRNDYKYNNDYNNVMIGNISFLQTRLSSTRNKIFSILLSIIGGILAGLGSYYLLSYKSLWINILLSICSLLMFLTLSIATAPVIWQSISWVLIKLIERSLWTLFVWTQKTSFIEYSKIIEFNNDIEEAILYIAIIPMIIGCIMFYMFSNIARMNIPFINIKQFASDVLARFNLREALKVGVYSTLLYNSILWIPAELAILTWESAGILFLMMVAVPCVTNAICVLFLYLLLSDIDDDTAFLSPTRTTINDNNMNNTHPLITNNKEISDNL